MSFVRLVESATPTTPSAGKQVEWVDNFSPLPRRRRTDSAGNTWPSADIFMMSLAADYTLTDSATAQKAFNATTNGAITLPANSGYLLEAEYLITSTGTTSHQWSVLFAGTASLTALDLTSVRGRTGVGAGAFTADASASQSNGAGSLPTTALSVTAASVSATEYVLITIRGTLRINAAGTFIPQVKLSATTTGTPKMLRGSFIRLTPIGTDTASTLGPWS